MFSVPFSDIPPPIWDALDWLLGVEGVAPPHPNDIRDAATHGLVFPQTFNWFLQRHKVVTEGKMTVRVRGKTRTLPRSATTVPPATAGTWARASITSHGRMALQWRAAQVNSVSLTPDDVCILAMLSVNPGKALTFSKIATQSVTMNRADHSRFPRRLNDSIIRKRMPVLLTLGLVARPVGTRNKGVGITDKGIQALRFAGANRPQTERKS